MKKFEVGEVVKVIGQDVKMTIKYVAATMATCQWFDTHDHLHEADFKKEVLEYARDN